jgi:integrase
MPPKLEIPSQRLKLPIARKPVFVKVVPGWSLGYRRNNSAGTWMERVAIGGGNYTIKAIGHADDFEPADNEKVLAYQEAWDNVRARARESERRTVSITVATALDRYEADLRRRGREVENVSRVRHRLPLDLATTEIRELAAKRLRAWRDGLVNLAPASVNRTITVLRAALNLAADGDETITNGRAWEIGLAGLPNADRSRNETSILLDPTIRQLVGAAHEADGDFGLLIEVLAVTGARIGQAARLTVRDLQDSRLMMPPSHKGRGSKPNRIPVPISANLATRLRREAPPDATLLVQADGSRWPVGRDGRAGAVRELWARVATRCGVTASMYALRHSSIVRQLLAGVPIRVIAVAHDTSIQMIERTYSRHIIDHADALVRGALLDI